MQVSLNIARHTALRISFFFILAASKTSSRLARVPKRSKLNPNSLSWRFVLNISAIREKNAFLSEAMKCHFYNKACHPAREGINYFVIVELRKAISSPLAEKIETFLCLIYSLRSWIFMTVAVGCFLWWVNKRKVILD